VHPSGFYEWIKEPLSRRAPEDDCQSDSSKMLGRIVVRFMDTVKYMMI
jgi:hypothetical protein